MNSRKSQDTDTLVFSKNKDTPSEGRNSMKIGGMWTLKHEISSPKFYELLIKKELKVCTDLELNNFYNKPNMCLNAVTIPQEDIIPS